jgi:hypothetical protein
MDWILGSLPISLPQYQQNIYQSIFLSLSLSLARPFPLAQKSLMKQKWKQNELSMIKNI